VFSGRGLCHELITRTEEFYRLWCDVVCDLETSRTSRHGPRWAAAQQQQQQQRSLVYNYNIILNNITPVI